MPTTYILDTNVLLSDPKSLFHFEEHEVVIPIQCIAELDKFKREHLSARGQAARTVSRYLDKLRERGSLLHGVPLHGGGKLRVDFGNKAKASLGVVDDHIIELAKRHGDDVVLVSRDTNMRIKADVSGVKAEDYRHDLAPSLRDESHGYLGYVEHNVEFGIIDGLYDHGSALVPEGLTGLWPHQFVLLRDPVVSGKSALTRYTGNGHLRLCRREPVWGIQPRSKGQVFALDALMDPKVSLVTMSGNAGTGKTLLALAAGLCQTTDKETYRRTLVARPLVAMGKEVGFLPGELDEKLRPWMQPIFDNLEVLLGSEDEKKSGYLIDRGHLKVEALSFIRGRSIPHQFLIVDEAQNLSPHEAKTILTRAGEDTKVVMTGDPAQIDNPYVDTRSNGLSYVIEAFKGSPLAAHVTLEKGERSPLADEAAKLL